MEDPNREMETICTCIESVLRDLKLLQKNRENYSYALYRDKSADITTLRMNLPCLKTFLWGARKWINNDVCSDLESNGVNLRSFLSSIEENLKKFEENIHSFCLRPQSARSENEYISGLEPVVRGFLAKIRSFKDGIGTVYDTLLDRRSSRRQCFSDDELVEFVDYVLQNLAVLLRHLLLKPLLRETSTTVNDHRRAGHARFETLQHKLTFSKNLTRMAKLRGIERGLLEDLLNHLKFGVLNTAYFAYLCSFDEYFEQMIDELLIEPDEPDEPDEPGILQIFIEVLNASKSSALLHSTEMAKHIMGDFNDSLISTLWPMLWRSTSIMDCLKNQMIILYEGLRFLRSILREPQENVLDELNGSIVDAIICAGIIICLLYDSDVKQTTCIPRVFGMLADTKKHIQHIKDQTSKSSTIISLHSDHWFTGQKAGSSSSTLMVSKGNMPKVHEIVVGFDDEARIVIDRLTKGSKQLEIVPIVGMAGVGKTTLAKKIYDDTSIEQHFHIRRWCTVSQSRNNKKLLLQLLGNSDKNDKEHRTQDEDHLLGVLHKMLKRSRYLVVFDDVWDIRLWNDLKIAFSNDNEGSRILFTSQFSNVAAQIEPYNLRLRTDEESWQLLKNKVFGDEDCPQSLLGPGREIANFCKGLPLTVAVIAGVLATKEHDKWTDFAKSLTSMMVSGTDPCKESLELCYEHLPYHLKPCLLYMGAFQEDQKIGTKNLKWLWIAEGFVEKADGKNPEDIAEKYMMDLIDRNLVMVSERRSIDGGVKACGIHDLLLEFCKSKAKEENFLQALRGYDELSTLNVPPNLRRISICSSGEDFKKSGLFCPHLESLQFLHQTAADKFPLVDMSFIFCIYKRLLVLNLEHIVLMQTEFPSGVESLLDLRYLALRSNSMPFIPQSISKLSNLETFRLKTYCSHVGLPDTIWNMKKLRHLYVRYSNVTLPLLPNDNDLENSFTLPDLHTLSTLELPLGQEGENIMRKIPNVRQLKVFLTDREIGECRRGMIKRCNMSRLESLESLEVKAFWGFGEIPNIEFSFPSTLRKLSLADTSLPWSKISLIEKLPNLEVLKLLFDSFSGYTWEMIEGGFPKLRILTLSEVYVVEWTESGTDSDDYFPCLQQLNLIGNLSLKKIPSCLERLSTLEMIKVRFSVDIDDDNFSIDNYSVVSLLRRIEEKQKGYGHENLKILIDYVREEM